MKKHELQLKRTESIRKMSALVKTAGDAERGLTEDEQGSYDTLKGEVAEFARLITEADELETLERSIVETDDNAEVIENKRDLKTKEFKIADAIRQAAEGSLSGVALEMHDRSGEQGVLATNKNTILIPAEAIGNSERAATLNVTTGAALIHKAVATDLDIIVPVPMYQKLGVRVLPGLNGNLGLPAQKHNEATFPGEGITVIENPNQPTGVTLTPQRVGLTESVGKEMLNSGNAALFSAIISDMIAGIDSAISRRVITKASTDALAGNISDGSTTYSGGYGDVTAATLTGLEALVEEDGSFVFPRGGFAILKAKAQEAGHKNTIIQGKFSEGETFDGYKARGTSFCPAGVIVYGAWKHVTVGMWDGIEVIVDPYTRAKFGEVEITVNRLVDAQVRNAEGFAVINSIP